MTLRKMCCLLGTGTAAASFGQSQDLGSLSIDDLMKVEVVSASKFAQSLKSVPAAIYVLSSEDIKRSGATNIPDMLRLVPGVQVAQIDANKWMISIRGFNTRYSDKLQVLIDGHSIYTATISGVYWDEFNIPPDNIDRIEVIRGPGGAVWGANAVNGVINIITKRASETQGAAVDAGGGDPVHSIARMRVGGKIGKDFFYSVYAEQMGFDNLTPTLDVPGNDGWHALRAGFRVDGTSGSNSFTVTGYDSTMHMGQVSLFPDPNPPYTRLDRSRWTNEQRYITGLWTKDHGHGTTSEFKTSFSSEKRDDPDSLTRRETIDVEYRMSSVSPSAKVSWGVSLRHNHDQLSGLYTFDPPSKMDDVYGGFYQIEKRFRHNLKLTLGSTIEHNVYTGIEVQPSARLLWDKNSKETYWAGISHAVKTPSRAEAGSIAPYQYFDSNGQLVEIELVGNPNIRSQTLTAFEVGARYQPSPRAMFDVTGFVNAYDNLNTFEPMAPLFVNDPVPHTVLRYQFDNKAHALTGGLELNAQLLPQKDWKLQFNFSFFTDKFGFDPSSHDAFGVHGGNGRTGSNPRYTIGLRSSHDLGKGISFDANALYVDAQPSTGIPAYTRLDLRLGWKPNKNMEFALSGQNLLQPNHVEGYQLLTEVPSKLRRGILLTATWRF